MSETRSNVGAGWQVFAAIMMVLIGSYHVVIGLVAILEDTFYVVGEEWAFEFDVTAWGWIHLIVGVIVAAAGFGIFAGSAAARGIGVVVALLSAIANFIWLPYYPLWAIIVIAIDVAVIWALTTHGDALSRT